MLPIYIIDVKDKITISRSWNKTKRLTHKVSESYQRRIDNWHISEKTKDLLIKYGTKNDIQDIMQLISEQKEPHEDT